jgi:polar amino acid transport system substrate-binding protein
MEGADRSCAARAPAHEGESAHVISTEEYFMRRFPTIVLLLTMTFTASSALAAESILDKVKASGKVAACTQTTVPPMSYMDEKNQHIGFDLDFGKALVEKLGAKLGKPIQLEWVVCDEKTRIAFLQAGRVQMSVSSMSHTNSRDESIDFVDPPYMFAGKSFMAKKGRFKSIKDLVGKKIAVQSGSSAIGPATDLLKSSGDANPQMVGFNTNGEAWLGLKQGKADAFTQDNVIMVALMGADGKDFEQVGPAYSVGLFSIGVPQDDSRWRDALSMAQQETMKDGTYDKIYDAWFGPKGKFPMATNMRPHFPADTYGEGKYYIYP